MSISWEEQERRRENPRPLPGISITLYVRPRTFMYILMPVVPGFLGFFLFRRAATLAFKPRNDSQTATTFKDRILGFCLLLIVLPSFGMICWMISIGPNFTLRFFGLSETAIALIVCYIAPYLGILIVDMLWAINPKEEPETFGPIGVDWIVTMVRQARALLSGIHKTPSKFKDWTLAVCFLPLFILACGPPILSVTFHLMGWWGKRTYFYYFLILIVSSIPAIWIANRLLRFCDDNFYYMTRAEFREIMAEKRERGEL
jgi:hypothetical protein